MECTKCSAFKLTVNGLCYECQTFQLLNPKLIEINLLNSRHAGEKIQPVKPKLIKINLLNSRNGSGDMGTGIYMGEISNSDYLAKRC